MFPKGLQILLKLWHLHLLKRVVVCGSREGSQTCAENKYKCEDGNSLTLTFCEL